MAERRMKYALALASYLVVLNIHRKTGQRRVIITQSDSKLRQKCPPNEYENKLHKTVFDIVFVECTKLVGSMEWSE